MVKKKISAVRIFCIIGAFCATLSVDASAIPAGVENADCQSMIAAAEKNDNPMVYEACGFDDYQKAWSYWGPWVSEHNYARAMYELCVRYPTSDYGVLYCRKSAELGYAPAVVQIAHYALEAEEIDSAYMLYDKALKTKKLNVKQIADVSEKLGVLHLMKGDYYSPEKSALFFKEAAKNGSALGNQVMGYLSFTGELKIPENKEESFKYLWRAVLLGCSAAEENLGVFHLFHQKKISFEVAAEAMKSKAFTCTGTPVSVVEKTTQPESNCPCQTLKQTLNKYADKPYILLATGNKILKQNNNIEELIQHSVQSKNKQDLKWAVVAPTHGGDLTVVQLKGKLPDASIVAEIRPTAVILMQGNQRIILNMYKSPMCYQTCLKNEKNQQLQKVGGVLIKPYHLSFTASECADIKYYAELLLPNQTTYTGREACLLRETGQTAEDKLLSLVQKKQAVSAPVEDNQNMPGQQNDNYSEKSNIYSVKTQPISQQDMIVPKTGGLNVVEPNETFVVPEIMPHIQPDNSSPQAQRRLQLQGIISERKAAYRAYEQKRLAAEAAAEADKKSGQSNKKQSQNKKAKTKK